MVNKFQKVAEDRILKAVVAGVNQVTFECEGAEWSANALFYYWSDGKLKRESIAIRDAKMVLKSMSLKCSYDFLSLPEILQHPMRAFTFIFFEEYPENFNIVIENL